jgi:ketosteroid isomerase-like protein
VYWSELLGRNRWEENAVNGPTETIERLAEVTNAHDLEALVACFAEDYQLETPAHPSRRFQGREQVRRNWEQIFAAVPDIRTEIRSIAIDGDRAWSEWDMRGTRRDGSAHHMAGVIVFGVRDGLIRWGRFFLEPVDGASTSMDDAVRQQVVRA